MSYTKTAEKNIANKKKVGREKISSRGIDRRVRWSGAKINKNIVGWNVKSFKIDTMCRPPVVVSRIMIINHLWSKLSKSEMLSKAEEIRRNHESDSRR